MASAAGVLQVLLLLQPIIDVSFAA